MKYLAVLLFLCFSLASKAEVLALENSALLEWINENKTDIVIVDIRTQKEYQSGHIPGSVNIPHNEIINNVSLLDAYLDKQVILHCEVGGRVKRTLNHLDSNKFKKLYHLQGDMRAWRDSKLPVEK